MTDLFIPFSPSAGGLFRLAIGPDDAAALADSLDAMGSSGAAIFDPDGRKVGGAALYGTAQNGNTIISLNLFDAATAEKIAAGVYVGAVLNTDQPGLILTDSPLTKGANGTLEKLDGRASGLALAKAAMEATHIKGELRKVNQTIAKQDRTLAKIQSGVADLNKRLAALERLPAVPKMPIRHRADDAIGA